MNTLLPIGTKVKHSGHGFGAIVAYNGVPKNDYLERNTEGAIKVAAEAGLLEAVITSMYSSDRYPYVVLFDPTERYPEGYKDVYDVDEVVLVVVS